MTIFHFNLLKNSYKRFYLSSIRLFIIGFLGFSLTIFSAQITLSQVSTAQDVEKYYQDQGIVSRWNLQGVMGNIVYAPVKLDGKVLFLVAAPAYVNQKKDSNTLSPLEIRVKSIEAKLQGILKRDFDPESLNVSVSILNGQTIIIVSDNKQLTPQPILTVTELDAELHGKELSDLAEEGAKYIHNVLLEAWKQRQPDYLKHQSLIAIAIALILIITSRLWRWLRRKFKVKWQKYKEQLAKLTLLENQEISEFPSENLANKNAPNKIIEREKERDRLTVKIQRLNFWIWIFNFGLLFLWLFGIAQILDLFPYSRELGYLTFQKPKELLFIGLVVFLINKGFNPLINRLFTEWQEEVEAKILLNQASERDLIRIDTLINAIKAVKTFIILTIGLFFALQRLGIPITPLVAGAGVIGFAISFGSQNFIKSLISGVSNFWLDAYAVGDSIVVENVSGTVEKINLFFTQIRNNNGSLITIPNSRIEVIENQTRDWSQVNFTIQVAYNTDVDKALNVISKTAEELYQDPNWQQDILETPNLLGVDNLDHSGLTVRLLVKTQPGVQWKVGRELRRRLRQQFELQGINIGIPQQVVNKIP